MYNNSKIRKYCLLTFSYICLLSTLVFFQYGFMLNILFPNGWLRTNAVIEREDTYALKYHSEGFIIKQADIKYVLDGKNYYSNVFMSYKDKVGDEIEIAVAKKDYKKVIRYKFLPLSHGTIGLNIISLIFILIYFFKDFRKKIIEKKSGNVICTTLQKNQNSSELNPKMARFKTKWEVVKTVVIFGVLICLIIWALIQSFK